MKLPERRSEIISEYMSGDQSYEALGQKYGVKARTIQTWVRAYRRKHPDLTPSAPTNEPVDVGQLKKKIEELELKNELLDEMLRLSEEATGIDFRKKYGTRRS